MCSVTAAPGRRTSMIENFEKKMILSLEDPKWSVTLLVEALRPYAFRSRIKAELKRPINKLFRKDAQKFILWMKNELAELMKFEVYRFGRIDMTD